MKTRSLNTLILSLNYAPEPTGNAPYSTKLAEGLKKRGMNVKVLTGFPHYPEWTIRQGYKGHSIREIISEVPVHRLRHAVPAKPTALSRLHMELSYGLRSVFVSWRDTEVVLAVSPALFSTGLAVLKARLIRKPIGVWVQDLYSRGLEETQGRTTVSSKLMKIVEGSILRSATEVSVIHQRFRDYAVEELKVPSHRVTIIRNWSHITIDEAKDSSLTRSRLGWAKTDFIVLHAGNMGVKQNLENVIDAARIAEERGSKIRYVLLGHGNQRAKLQDYAGGLANVTFIDPLPDSEFADAIQSADALLVNEMPGVREMSVPSKLTSYFATGLPVIACTENDSATADEIRASNSGLLVSAGQPGHLQEAAERLEMNPELAASLGSSGIPYVNRTLSEDLAITSYFDWLSRISKLRD